MSAPNLPRILVVDLETASPVDIKKEGQFRYWADPGTRVLMSGVGWLYGTDDVHVFDHEAAEELDDVTKFNLASGSAQARITVDVVRATDIKALNRINLDNLRSGRKESQLFSGEYE